MADYDWKSNYFDLLKLGNLIGHLIENGAQNTDGNSMTGVWYQTERKYKIYMYKGYSIKYVYTFKFLFY